SVLAGPYRKALVYQGLRQRIEGAACLRPQPLHLGSSFGKGQTPDMRIQIVGGFDQLRDGYPGRKLQNAVFNVAVLGDENSKGLARLELYKLDMLQWRVRLGGQDNACTARQSRKHLACLGQHVLQRLTATCRNDLRLDDLALLLGEITDFHERIDEKPQTLLRWQAARRNVGRVDQPQMLKVAHDIPDGGWRELLRQTACEVARPQRVTFCQIVLDHEPEYLA